MCEQILPVQPRTKRPIFCWRGAAWRSGRLEGECQEAEIKQKLFRLRRAAKKPGETIDAVNQNRKLIEATSRGKESIKRSACNSHRLPCAAALRPVLLQWRYITGASTCTYCDGRAVHVIYAKRCLRHPHDAGDVRRNLGDVWTPCHRVNSIMPPRNNAAAPLSPCRYWSRCKTAGISFLSHAWIKINSIFPTLNNNYSL